MYICIYTRQRGFFFFYHICYVWLLSLCYVIFLFNVVCGFLICQVGSFRYSLARIHKRSLASLASACSLARARSARYRGSGFTSSLSS